MKSTTNKPTVFIGSSSEAIDVLDKLCVAMKKWSKPTKWCEIFTAGEVTIDSLLKKIPEYDLCVFIWSEDDDLRSRGKEYKVARDNVIFETGIAHGVMGRQKSFIVTVGEVKSISDLAGVTYIDYRVGDAMTVVSNQIKKAFSEGDGNTKKTKKLKEMPEIESDANIIDFNRAKIRRAQSGIGIIDELEIHMLNSDKDAFIEALEPLSTNNSTITENSFLMITSQCMIMQLPHYALEIIEFANRKFPKSDRIKIMLMDVLIKVGTGDNECQVRAHKMVEEFFCIKQNDKGLPIFTEASKSKKVFEHDHDRLQTIFDVYIAENDYESLLSLIDSCPIAGIDSSDVFVNGYKAHALAECGQTEAAREIYENILPDNPNDRRLLQLANVLIDCNEKTKGYRLFELNAINYFDSKSLILLAKKIHDIQICRTLSNGFINTEFNHNASKKVIVPLLFKAVEKAPFETTLKEVKNMLVTLGAREEYDFIKENEHMPYGIFSNLRNDRFDAYTWDILDYIETENIAEKNVGDAAVKFREKIFEILKEDSMTMNIEED